MNIPENKEMIEGEIAFYWIEDGILFAKSKPVLRTVENIGGNIKLVQEITSGKKCRY